MFTKTQRCFEEKEFGIISFVKLKYDSVGDLTPN